MASVVTGGAGFVGLNLIEALLASGQEVVSVSDRPLPPSALASFAALPGRLTTVEADLTRDNDLSGLLRRHGAERLFPFAAITPSPAREAEQPETIVSTNVTALIGQLRAARDAGVARVVVPGSVAVYGDSLFAEARLCEATTPCTPKSLYAVTKQAAESAALRMAELWDLDVVVARIGNVFGRWEHHSGARETFGPHFRLYEMAASGRDAVLPAAMPRSGSIYSRDLSSALLHLSDLRNRKHDVFNVCTGEDWSNALPLWAEELRTVFPAFRWRRAADGDEATIALHETRPRALVDMSRLRESGWNPVFRPAAAYRDYADWIRRAGFTEARPGLRTARAA